MVSINFNNLVNINQLKKEMYDQAEFNGLVNSGKIRLQDAQLEVLSLESRFDLAYNAAHSLALAALRYKGYRSGSRYIVFQVLPITLDMDQATTRVLSKCHDKRNLAEYEGVFIDDPQLFIELLHATQTLLEKVEALGKKR